MAGGIGALTLYINRLCHETSHFHLEIQFLVNHPLQTALRKRIHLYRYRAMLSGNAHEGAMMRLNVYMHVRGRIVPRRMGL